MNLLTKLIDQTDIDDLRAALWLVSEMTPGEVGELTEEEVKDKILKEYKQDHMMLEILKICDTK